MKRMSLCFVAFLLLAGTAHARVQYINPYYRSNGTYVSGHYKDTSGDGNPYNNANYLGYNDYDYGYDW